MATSSNDLDEAVRQLRAVILAGERYRQVLAERVQLGVTETQAISYLTVYGDRGPTELAADLGLTSGSSTALVDRLERQGIAERYAHPSDRRRAQVRLTAKGRAVVQASHDWLAVALDDIPASQLAEVSVVLRSIADRLAAQSQRMRDRTDHLLDPSDGPDQP